MRARPAWALVGGLVGVVALAAGLTGGCGGLPAQSTTTPTTATVVVTLGPAGTQTPLDEAAVVICGGVRAAYDPKQQYVVLQGVPLGSATPPTQPLTVTASGYVTYSQWVDLTTTTATYADAGLTAADLTTTGTVQGTITDEASAQPIANVDVKFSQDVGGTTTTVEGFTDSTGQFIIGGIPIGNCDLNATATGYLQYTGQTVVAQDQGGTNQPLTLQLISGTTKVKVSGVVVDLASESPIAGATVTLGGDTATTGSDGSFSFAAVQVGSADLAVTAKGFDDYKQTLTIIPGMAALRVEMTEASPSPPPPPHNVSGTVTIRNRPDDSGAVVTAYNIQLGMAMAQYTTGADGAYYLFVPPGNYEIRVNFEGQQLVQQVTVPGGGRVVTGIDFLVAATPTTTTSGVRLLR